MQPIIGNFHVLRPSYEVSQEAGLKWVSRAHAYAKYCDDNVIGKSKTLEELISFMEVLTNRFACKPEKIANRGTSIPDFLHTNWEEMNIFNLSKGYSGALLQERMAFFDEVANKVFAELYSKNDIAPHNLIHVTCTGYSAPSSAQLLVAKKNWGNITKVTHAYHMGCYASLPAIRMGHGFLLQDKLLFQNIEQNIKSKRVDVVHTEMCTLHFNPANHDPAQFVAQSLFADGYILYSIFDKDLFVPENNVTGFEVIICKEMIFPNCADAMTWKLFDFGFQMELSGRVPNIIAENIEYFLNVMFNESGMSFQNEKNNCIYAIHPGGPKIIRYIKDILELPQKNISHSEEVLSLYGNMSSATLPHVWDRVLNSGPNKSTLVVSLAFGPGLTLSGAIMRAV